MAPFLRQGLEAAFLQMKGFGTHPLRTLLPLGMLTGSHIPGFFVQADAIFPFQNLHLKAA
jgi:hypothetical protein